MITWNLVIKPRNKYKKSHWSMRHGSILVFLLKVWLSKSRKKMVNSLTLFKAQFVFVIDDWNENLYYKTVKSMTLNISYKNRKNMPLRKKFWEENFAKIHEILQIFMNCGSFTIGNSVLFLFQCLEETFRIDDIYILLRIYIQWCYVINMECKYKVYKLRSVWHSLKITKNYKNPYIIIKVKTFYSKDLPDMRINQTYFKCWIK